MKLRSVLTAICVLVFAVGGSFTTASSDQLGTVVVKVAGPNSEPIRLASVKVTAGTSAETYVTNDAGTVSFRLKPGTYKILVTFGTWQSRSVNVTATADKTMTYVVRLYPSSAYINENNGSRAPPASAGEGAPPPEPPPPPPPPPAAPIAPPQAVTQSLLTAYNGANPEHVTHKPYYGRYTYVVLVHKDARSLAFLSGLIAKSVSTVGHIGAPTGFLNTLSYNLFLVPVVDGAAFSPSSTLTQWAQALLDQYDFQAASNVRTRYCGLPGHQAAKICKPPMDDGPITLTLARPLKDIASGGALSPSITCDFTGVDNSRFEDSVAKLETAVDVPMTVTDDVAISTPQWKQYLANWLGTLNSGLLAIAPGISVYLDLKK